MDEHSKKGASDKLNGAVRSAPIRTKRRAKGAIGPDGKSPVPAIITAVFIILLLVAVYFGKISGCFANTEEQTSVDETLRPEVTPMPSLSQSDPMSALNDKTLTVYAVDVGSGECSLLVSPNGKTMLIDSGDEAHYPAVSALLSRLGVTRLDIVIATAAGSGHVGAMPSVINDYQIGSMYVCPGVGEGDEAWANMLDAIESKPSIKLSELYGGKSGIKWDNSCNVNILLPIESAAEGCMVIRAEHSGKSILFTSELDEEMAQKLVNRYSAEELRSTVLRVASCGAEGSVSDALLKAVSPSYAVISVGTGMPGCPADATLAKLNSRGVAIKRTDKNGTVKIVIEKSVITVL